ncbi:MAG: Mpo1-like protein [Bdellovibrionota bacterium]
MALINRYFADYESYHRTKGNKVCHIWGISIIVISALGLLNNIVLFDWGFPVPASAALVLWLLGNIFYLTLHAKLGLTLMVSTAAAYFLGTALPTPVLWSLFVAGWVIQFIGHYKYEKKSPAFYKNLIHLMIGPAYIQNYLLKIVRK